MLSKAAWYGQDAHTSYVLFFFLEVDILAFVFRKYLAVGLAWWAFVVEFFFHDYAVVVLSAATLGAARSRVLLLATVGVVGTVAELLRHALYAQIDEADDADEEDGYHQHHDKYAFQK